MPARYLRISLRLSLLLTLLIAAGLGWFSVSYLQPYRAEAAAVEWLSRFGATVECESRQPEWFWRIFGPQIAQSVSTLSVYDRPLGAAEIERICKLKSLRGLQLIRAKLTNAGMSELTTLTKLQDLNLRFNEFSQFENAFPELIALDLSYTNVSQLRTESMRCLESLDLKGTKVDDGTLASLSPMPKLRTLNVGGSTVQPSDISNVSDLGIAHLTPAKFPSLTRIFLYRTAVTQEGIQAIKTRFPDAGVYHNGEETGTPQPAEIFQVFGR
jgi:hypothetical protein